MPFHPLTGKPCSKGEFDSVTAHLKKEAKMIKASKGAAAAGGGGAAPLEVEKPTSARANAGKTRADLANEAAIQKLDEMLASLEFKPLPGLLSYSLHNLYFYRVTKIEDGSVTGVRRVRQQMKQEEVPAFLAANPGSRVEEAEFVRVRKIIPQPNFQTTALPYLWNEVSCLQEKTFPLTADLLKDNGKNGVRALGVGSIVGVRVEAGMKRQTVFIRNTDGGFYRDEMCPVSEERVFCVLGAEAVEKFELEGKLE